MKSRLHFDETNVALLEALRLNPRAPWEAVGRAIGVDGVTARRRWSRIVERRLAWTTVSAGNWPGQITAIVTARCRAGAALEVSRELAEIPCVVTIETMAGRQDVRCTVVVDDLASLSEFLSTHLRSVVGLDSVESQIVDRVYAQGSNWRPRALAPDAEKELSPASSDRRAYSDRLNEIDPALVNLLVEDARAPSVALANRLGVSETLVRRRINALAESGLLVLRVEAAPHLVGVPYSSTIWFAFSALELHDAASFLSTLPEARWTVTTVAGRANLVCVFWFRDFARLHIIERSVRERFADAQVVDRSIRLQAVKRMMHVLDDEGLTDRVIPWGPAGMMSRARG